MPNAIEFAFGSDPNESDDLPDFPIPTVDAFGRAEIRLEKPLGVGGVTCAVEIASDLDSWTTAALTVVDDSAHLLRVRTNDIHQSGSFRIRVAIRFVVSA